MHVSKAWFPSNATHASIRNKSNERNTQVTQLTQPAGVIRLGVGLTLYKEIFIYLNIQYIFIFHLYSRLVVEYLNPRLAAPACFQAVVS